MVVEDGLVVDVLELVVDVPELVVEVADPVVLALVVEVPEPVLLLVVEVPELVVADDVLVDDVPPGVVAGPSDGPPQAVSRTTMLTARPSVLSILTTPGFEPRARLARSRTRGLRDNGPGAAGRCRAAR